MRSIDLNSDLGESFGAWSMADDEAMLDIVTSANVACGFHAGDPTTMLRTVTAAASRGVSIGAQVSYPDLVGFGRRDMDIGHDDLVADVLYQLGALQAMCRAVGTNVAYLKPHGALYNRIVDDEAQATAVVDALIASNTGIPLVTLPDSAAAQVARAQGVDVVAEGFADRAYLADGSLAPRGVAGAVLTDPPVVAERARRMVVDGVVTTLDGRDFVVTVDSLCVHGDTPGAVDIAVAVRKALGSAGVTVISFR